MATKRHLKHPKKNKKSWKKHLKKKNFEKRKKWKFYFSIFYRFQKKASLHFGIFGEGGVPNVGFGEITQDSQSVLYCTLPRYMLEQRCKKSAQYPFLYIGTLDPLEKRALRESTAAFTAVKSMRESSFLSTVSLVSKTGNFYLCQCMIEKCIHWTMRIKEKHAGISSLPYA